MRLPDKVKIISDVFVEAQRKADISGKMLGCALALKYPFRDHTISITGFSLGTQVVKSCLETLHKVGSRDII